MRLRREPRLRFSRRPARRRLRRAVRIGAWSAAFASLLAVVAWDVSGLPDDAPPEVASVPRGESHDRVTAPQDAYPTPLPTGREAGYVALNQGDLATADGLLRDRWPIRGHDPVHLDWPLTWHEDPYDDAYFRFQLYSLQPTAHLLWAYRTTGEARYRDKLLAILGSYLDHDERRAPDEDRFDNEHAAAFRAMVLVNTWVKLRASGDLTPALDRRLQGAIDRLGGFLADPAHFEPGVNHAYSEAFALAIVADNRPDDPNAGAWAALARERLLQTLRDTIDADGVEVENSPFYHVFVLGLVQQIGAWAATYRPALAPAFRDAADRMLPYAADLTYPDGTLPLLGATGRSYVSRQDPHVFGPLAERSARFRWAYTDGAAGEPPPLLASYGRSGHSVLRSGVARGTGPAEQTIATFTAGRYRTEHSHLGALGVTLYAGGREVLPEAGLYSYLPGPWFDYFHGTRGHNTVLVDGRDQAAGPATTVASGALEDGAWVSGRSELYPGVVHDRVAALVDRDVLLVVDRLRSRERHAYDGLWHLPAGATLVPARGGQLVLDGTGQPLAQVAFGSPGSLRQHVVTGATSPVQGWISTHYGEKAAAPTLIATRRARDATFVTVVVAGRVLGQRVAVQDGDVASGKPTTVCVGGSGYAVTIGPEQGGLVLGGVRRSECEPAAG